MLDPALLDALRARLDASRAALLAALEGVTERDFAVDLGGGETVVRALAALAAAERLATASASGEPVTERTVEKPLPPQVVHALAGARYRTHRYLESAAADAGTAETLAASLVTREKRTAARIRERPRSEPPPVIPVASPR